MPDQLDKEIEKFRENLWRGWCRQKHISEFFREATSVATDGAGPHLSEVALCLRDMAEELTMCAVEEGHESVAEWLSACYVQSEALAAEQAKGAHEALLVHLEAEERANEARDAKKKRRRKQKKRRAQERRTAVDDIGLKAHCGNITMPTHAQLCASGRADISRGVINYHGQHKLQQQQDQQGCGKCEIFQKLPADRVQAYTPWAAHFLSNQMGNQEHELAKQSIEENVTTEQRDLPLESLNIAVEPAALASLNTAVEPAAVEVDSSSDERYEQAITEIYQQHRKTQLSKIPELMQKSAEKEAELDLTICNRFGVTPDPCLKVAREAQAELSCGAEQVQDLEAGYNDLMQVPEYLVCPISFELFVDPVVCMDGQTYERAAIEEWLVDHDTSPLTNVILPSKVVVPNYALLQAIASLSIPARSRKL
jgi:hypothetical protein